MLDQNQSPIARNRLKRLGVSEHLLESIKFLGERNKWVQLGYQEEGSTGWHLGIDGDGFVRHEDTNTIPWRNNNGELRYEPRKERMSESQFMMASHLDSSQVAKRVRAGTNNIKSEEKFWHVVDRIGVFLGWGIVALMVLMAVLGGLGVI